MKHSGYELRLPLLRELPEDLVPEDDLLGEELLMVPELLLLPLLRPELRYPELRELLRVEPL